MENLAKDNHGRRTVRLYVEQQTVNNIIRKGYSTVRTVFLSWQSFAKFSIMAFLCQHPTTVIRQVLVTAILKVILDSATFTSAIVRVYIIEELTKIITI